jgi:hypothetical protein
LPNGGFDKINGDFSVNWNKGIHGKATGEFKLVKRGSGNALQVTKLNNQSWIECLSDAVPVSLNSVGLFEVSGMFKADGVKAGSIVFIGYGKRKVMAWNRLEIIKGSGDWKTIKAYVFVPQDVKKLRLSLRIEKGEGRVLFDDFSIVPIKKGLPTGVQLIKKEWLGVYGKNTGKLPGDWSVKSWSAMETRFEAKGDRQGVCLRWISGGAKFGIEPGLWLNSVSAGTNLKMTARYKAIGKGEAVLMAEFFDKNDQRIGEQVSDKGVLGSWNNLSHIFTVPRNAAKMRFYLLNTGRGSVRYISAALTKTDETSGSKKYPVTVYCSPAEGNRIIFNGKTLFNTIVDSPNSLSFDFWGDKDELKNLAFVMEVPEGLNIAQCFNSHPAIISAAKPEISNVQIAGKQYKRYVYKNLKAFSLMKPVISWRRQVVLAFEPVKTDIKLPADFKAYFYMQDDTKGKSRKKELTIRVLPKLKQLPNPKNFPVYNWADGDINFPDMPLFMRVIKKYEEANLNSRSRDWRPTLKFKDQILEKRGWYMHNPEQDYTQTRIVKGLTNNLKDARIAIKDTGKKEPEHICPEYFLNDKTFTDNLTAFLVKKYRKLGAKARDYVLLDYEPWRTMEWCFCPQCRSKFSKMVNAGKVLSAKDIIAKYSDKWVQFRIEQTAAINRKTASIIKKIVPGIVVVDYDYPVKFDSPNYREFFKSVPKDPRSYEDCVDAHLSSFYHYLKKDAFDLIDVNVKNLKRPVYMTPALSRNDPLHGSYTTNEETLSPQQFRVTILGAACSGSKGLCIYPGLQIDGLFFVYINRAMGEIAVIEDFLEKGTRQDSKVKLKQLPNRQIKAGDKTINLPKWAPESGLRVHKLGNDLLVSIFNFSSRYTLFTGLTIASNIMPKQIVISDAISKCRILPPSGKAYWTVEELNEKLLLKIPSMDVKFYLFKPYKGNKAVGGAQNNAVIHKEYKRELEADKTPAFKPVVCGTAKAVLTDANQDGVPDVEVLTPVQKVVISQKGGIVLDWQVKGLTVTGGIGSQKQDSMCWDYFLVPMEKYSSNNPPYTLKSVKCVNGNFIVTLETDFKASKLRLQKTFTVSTTKATFDVKYTITNMAEQQITFSFWSHNFPSLLAVDKLNDLVFKLDNTSITGKGKGEQVFSYKNRKVVKFAPRYLVGNFTKPEITCFNKKNKASLRVELDHANLNQVYLYRGKNPTFEWMTRKISLQPKQSCSTWMRVSLNK